MKKKEERTLKRKTLLKAGLGRNSFETATGQPPNKKRVPVHRKLFFVLDCPVALSNIFLPILV